MDKLVLESLCLRSLFTLRALYCGGMLIDGRVEFVDLWHDLKVPDDVDLIRQLATGELPFFRPLFYFSPPRHRGSPSYGKSSSPRQGTKQEEGKERRGTTPTTNPSHQYAFEGRNRSVAGFRGARKMSVFRYVILFFTDLMYLNY